MAEILLEVVAETAFKKVDSLLTEQMSLVLDFKKQLTSLRSSLAMTRAVLRDAERRQSRDEGVEEYLKRLKDVAYKADDVLDEFAYEVLRRKVEIRNQMRRKVFFFFSSSNPIAFRLKMGNKIKDINTSLDKINGDAIKFGLERGGVGMVPPQVALNRESDSFLDNSGVIGRENEASKIVEMLVNSSDQEALSVIPIVGMGGLGKTTLAKLIYNDERIDRLFPIKIWLCVSHNFDTNRLLKEILETLTRKKCDVQIRDVILRELEKEFGEKKYLLILDDVWNEDCPSDWECFRSCLSGVNKTKGNNILVTTRKRRVASIMGTRETHYLQGLSEDNCWSIVKQKAFAAGGTQMTPELETIGIEIARKCHGVPLAANVIGGMLFAKKERHEWLEVQNSQIWGSITDEKGVLGILKLSFDNLPYSSLKQCFAYCSILRQDTYIEKQRLIQLWMAVGFLQSDEESDKLMEDIGNEFFNVILWNSLFQDVKKDECDNIIGCQMHDLVHDLARSISKCESYSLEDAAVKVIPDVRHLALYSSGDTIYMLKEKAGYLHTLFLESGMPQNTEDFKCLRVLDFGGAKIKELSNSIGALIHLRYLDLSDAEIEVLPVSICKLYNLQTLRLGGCESLKELPNKLSNLISLRHLHLNTFAHRFKIPAGIGRLVCLQTLSFFSVGQVNGHQLNELGFLKHLRGELEIRNLEEVSGRDEAQRADLFGKTNLYKLRFVWSDNREGRFNDEDLLEGLQPHSNLKSLFVSNFLGDKFPTWMMKMAVNIDGKGDWLPLDSVMEIILVDCKRCEHIPMLGQLPNLRYLVLRGMNNVTHIDLSFGGHRNDSPNNTRTNETSASFPVLIKFTLEDMPNLVEWMEAEDDHVVFPRLEELTIQRCPKLTKFPSRFPFLKKLVVGGLLELSFGGHRNDSPKNTRSNETSASFPVLISFILQDMANLEEWMEAEDDDVVFPRLEELTVERCPKLTTFPSRFPCLKRLRIDGLGELGCLPDGLFENNIYPKLTTMWGCCASLLQELKIWNCSKLSILPDGLHTLLFLETLDIYGCENLNSIASIQGFKSLKALTIAFCDGLTCLPSGLLQFCTSLQTLWIINCRNLISVPELTTCHSLSWLIIRGCEKLSCLPEGLGCLTRLNRLCLGPLSDDVISFSGLNGIQKHFTALTYLSLSGYVAEALPDCFSNLSSLTHLYLINCQRLKCLPARESLAKLESLRIYNCPLLKERWSEIALHAKVTVDGTQVQYSK